MSAPSGWPRGRGRRRPIGSFRPGREQGSRRGTRLRLPGAIHGHRLSYAAALRANVRSGHRVSEPPEGQMSRTPRLTHISTQRRPVAVMGAGGACAPKAASPCHDEPDAAVSHVRICVGAGGRLRQPTRLRRRCESTPSAAARQAWAARGIGVQGAMIPNRSRISWMRPSSSTNGDRMCATSLLAAS